MGTAHAPGGMDRGVVVIDAQSASIDGALAEIADGLHAASLDARACCFAAFVAGHAADSTLHAALSALVDGAPILLVPTRALALAPALHAASPRLVVVAIADEAARAVRAAIDDDGPSATARLLEGGAMGRACLLSSTISEGALRATLLPSLDEQGALVVGTHATGAPGETAALFVSRGRVLCAIAGASSSVDDTPAAPDARAARVELEHALHALVSEARAHTPRLALVFTSAARDEGFFDVVGYDHERAVDVLLSLSVPIVTATVDTVCASSDDGAVALNDGCVIAVFVEEDDRSGDGVQLR